MTNEQYTNIFSGEDIIKIYVAVDVPNKGAKNSDGTYDISENQYNLNSYDVKFYSDPEYFDIVYHDIKTHQNPSLTQESNQSAINYMLPYQMLGLTFEDAMANVVSGWSESVYYKRL